MKRDNLTILSLSAALVAVTATELAILGCRLAGGRLARAVRAPKAAAPSASPSGVGVGVGVDAHVERHVPLAA